MVISPTPRRQCIIIRLYSDAWWNMHPTYQSPILSSNFIYLSLPCEETTLGWGGAWVWEKTTQNKTKHTYHCWKTCQKTGNKGNHTCLSLTLLTYHSVRHHWCFYSQWYEMWREGKRLHGTIKYSLRTFLRHSFSGGSWSWILELHECQEHWVWCGTIPWMTHIHLHLRAI